jgi:enoyl-CoA hydratase/carnithine racemase
MRLFFLTGCYLRLRKPSLHRFRTALGRSTMYSTKANLVNAFRLTTTCRRHAAMWSRTSVDTPRSAMQPSARCGVRSGTTTAPPRVQDYGTSTNSDQAAIHCKIQEHGPGHNVAVLTVSNPRKLNIVNTPLLLQLTEKCKELRNDQSLRAVILKGGQTGPGKAPAFIGGADVNEMYHIASYDQARQFITRVHLACKALRDLPVPVIASVDGYCLGAGLEIMASCDLRIATDGSTFAMPEVKVGIPSVVKAALLPGLIGMGRTRRLFYLAENIDASTAENWGLVDRVVSDQPALDTAVQDWVGKICEAGPAAIREQKRLMRKWEDCSTSEGIAAGINSFANAYKYGADEPREYMGRFLRNKIR